MIEFLSCAKWVLSNLNVSIISVTPVAVKKCLDGRIFVSPTSVDIEINTDYMPVQAALSYLVKLVQHHTYVQSLKSPRHADSCARFFDPVPVVSSKDYEF